MTTPKRKNRATKLLVLAAAITALSGATAIAFPTIPAVGGNVMDQAHHYWTCFGLMITDPAAHVTECGIGPHSEGLQPAHGSGAGGSPPMYTTTRYQTTIWETTLKPDV